MPFKYLEPVNKIPGGIATIELPTGKCVSTVTIQATVGVAGSKPAARTILGF
jgi:hypothetical protein